MSLVTRDRNVLWHPYTQEMTALPPLPIVRAKGVWLYTEDGRKILDGISSWWVNIHGHSHPFLNEALSKQAEKLEHTMFAGFTHEPAIELAEKLVEISPKNLSRVFYSDNGSTAVEVALKIAYQYWQNLGQKRNAFVALTNAYHGDTFGAMSASDKSGFTRSFQDLLFHVYRADSPNSYQCNKCEAKCNLSCLSSLEDILEKHHPEIAAVIIEPMLQGAGGMIIWESEFLEKVSKLCNQYNVLLIADEVLTGFGRTGKMFACEHARVSPDIMCLSKALTAGYLPLGATLVTEEIYEAFLSEDRNKTFFHGHSYTANPLACAVAVASLELFDKENSLEKVAIINKRFQQFFPSLLNLKCVGDVRIIGAVGVVELISETEGYLAAIGQALYKKLLTQNILIRPLGNVLYFMPPYIISENELSFVFEKIEKVISEID